MTNDRSGLYSITKQKPVVLTGINILSKIERFTAKTTIIQHFKNTEDVNIEAVYCFPIENPAALHSFKIKTPDKNEIIGCYEEKNNAYDIYDQCLENGDSAFKLELEEKNMIELAVGNLASGEEVTIEIEIISHLTTIDNQVSFRIPTALSPLYVPTGISWEGNSIASPPFQLSVPYGVYVATEINMPGVKNIHSPSHRIKTSKTRTGHIVSFSNNQEPPDRDFVLEFELDGTNLPQCTVSRHKNGHQALMFKFQPEFDSPINANNVKSDIIFMFDCSSSMAHSYIEPAKEALELCIRSMSEGDYFNVLVFGSSYRLFSENPMEYNQETLDYFLGIMADVQADMGGTELLEALKEVCKSPAMPGCRREIILITDGEVYNTREILQYAAQNHGNARFYTFGIGRGASPALVKGLADVTGGVSEIIAHGEDIRHKVLRQFSRLLQPEITNINLSTKNAKLKLPEKIQPLYEGDSLTILAEIEELAANAKIALTVEAQDEFYAWECEIEDIGEDDSIPLLWAVSHITHLEELSYVTPEKTDEYTHQILECAKKFNILSHYSSLLAIIERDQDNKALYYPSFRIVPIMLHHARCNEEDSMTELMASVHETPEPYLLSDYSSLETRNWYHEILKTQDAYGRFCSSRLVADHFRLSEDLFEKHLSRFPAEEADDPKAALLTAVIINLLKTDPEASSIAGRALKKAENWLNSLKNKDSVLKNSKRLLDELQKTNDAVE